MFEREHHRRVAQVLSVLDAEVLSEYHCWFGGGTAIALRFCEYRESRDIDFVVSDLAGYRGLRERLTEPGGLLTLMRPEQGIVEQDMEIRADQYGVRSAVLVDRVRIKFEIVLEGRISLEEPSVDDRICGVTCLRPVDMVATKLLANSDRGRDDVFLNRDAMDVALMQPTFSCLAAGMQKAQGAYGSAIHRDLSSALDRLRTRDGWLDRCLSSMNITLPKAVVLQRIVRLQDWTRRSGKR